MPARDIYHDTVKQALVKDGWTVTHDPYRLSWGKRDLYVDLGLERLLGAEREDRRIAVEVESFRGTSEMHDLGMAVGQFILYEDVLSQVEPERELFLAVRDGVFRETFEDPIGRLLIEKQHVRLVGFDEQAEAILRWIH